jgi:uncharacterized membrane protein
VADDAGSDLPALLRRVAALEERLAKLEAARLGVVGKPTEGARLRISEPESKPEILRALYHEPPLLKTTTPAVASAEAAAPLHLQTVPTPSVEAVAEQDAQALPSVEAVAEEHTLATGSEAQRAENLEQLIGLKWAGWIGAIVLVLGVGMGIHFAYVHGWFGHIPVELRLLLMALGGFALLAAGEVVYRRISPLSAVGVFGAGVGVLFVVSYAGNVYFGAYSYRTALAFAIGTMLIGSAVAIRTRLVSIAVLAQIGGQLGPLVIQTGEPPGVALLAYLLMLQGTALLLALWGGTPKWWVLRALSLAATSWWVLTALLAGHWGPGLRNEVLWFAVLYAAIYQGELLRSALVRGSAHLAPAPVRGTGTIFSLLVTAGLTAVFLHVFYHSDERWLRGGVTLLLAALCLVGGLLPWAQDNVMVRALRVGYQIQGLAFVLLFVPVTLTGAWIALAWGVLSLALGTLAGRFDRGVARDASAAAWFLALVRLAIDVEQTSRGGWAGQAWLTVLDHPVRGYTVLAWLLSGAGQGTAWLLQAGLDPHAKPAQRWWAAALAVSLVADVVWVAASLAGLPPLGATCGLVAWAWLLALADTAPQRLFFALQSLAVLFVASYKWVAYDVVTMRLAHNWGALDYYPVLNPQMGVGVVLAVSLVGIVRLRQRALDEPLRQYQRAQISGPARALGLIVLVLAILTLGLSFEVDRAVETAAVSGYDLGWPPFQMTLFGLTWLWTAVVVILVVATRRLRLRTSLAAVLLLPVAVKFLVIDMLWARFNSPAGIVSVPVLFNSQALTAAMVAVAVVVLQRLTRGEEGSGEAGQVMALAAQPTALLVLLCAGSLEIDRVFETPLLASLHDPRLAKNVTISLFWSLYAMIVIVAGFRWRVPGLRYFGLGLFAVTLAKVLLIDMSQVAFGYRILSLLGLGLVLLATSVLYGRSRVHDR